MATKAATAIPHSHALRSVREPMRQAACTTMAVTAGLMPYNTPATAGTWPKARYIHDSATRISSDGSTNSPPATMPPQRRCINQPM